MRTSRDIGRVIGVVAILTTMLFRATDAPAQSASCVASGTFVFTLGEGSGFLYLLADGRAEMLLIPTHEACATCLVGSRTLTGTYQTPRLADGQCVFILNLLDPGREPRNIEIGGVVAFQGSVLMFQAATVAGLGVGLALRSDTLTQPSAPVDSRPPPQ